ncbi:hypothetical protein KY285_035527 [Solanum tuberosum]|nr:hypothetical protein KY285_035527 [Solanum tuberosum]
MESQKGRIDMIQRHTKGVFCYDASCRQFDDDVVATYPLEQPMNYDHYDLQPSFPLDIDSTSSS